jgi:hypothetical protein
MALKGTPATSATPMFSIQLRLGFFVTAAPQNPLAAVGFRIRLYVIHPETSLHLPVCYSPASCLFYARSPGSISIK